MKPFRITLRWHDGGSEVRDYETMTEAMDAVIETSDWGESAEWLLECNRPTGEHIEDEDGEWHEEYQLKHVCMSDGWVTYDAPPARDLDDIPF